jgi:Ca2+-binding EF-hand superfamily protein
MAFLQLAHVINEKDFEGLRKLFLRIDENGDGLISGVELKNYLNANTDSIFVQNIRNEVTEKILEVIDQN